MKPVASSLLIACFFVTSLSAQEVQRSAAIASSEILSQISMFNFREGRKSDLLFRPTPIAVSGEGKVKVEYEDENAAIEAEVSRMPAPSSLGPYTTYVLWALTPDGRASNQGVIGDIEGGNPIGFGECGKVKDVFDESIDMDLVK